MSLHTGGRAIGATSTRSRSASRARRNASSIRTMPTCSPSGPTKRTSGTRIRSLMRGSTLMGPPQATACVQRAFELPRCNKKTLRHVPAGFARPVIVTAVAETTNTPPKRGGPDPAAIDRIGYSGGSGLHLHSPAETGAVAPHRIAAPNRALARCDIRTIQVPECHIGAEPLRRRRVGPGAHHVDGGLAERLDLTGRTAGTPDQPPFERRCVPDRHVGDVRSDVELGRLGRHRVDALARADEG